MTDAPRAVVYLRQSVSREDSVSLELQETACRDYCARHGYEVVRVLADPGISGRTWRRPGVVATLAMIEARQADVIVLWRWSRLSRSRRDWALAVDRVESAGGRIESATEPVDVSTASGRLARGMLTEIAAWDSEVKGEQWRETHARRVSMGLPPTGKPKFGYQYDRARKLHVPDPVTGPLLAECYRRYLAGTSFYSLVDWLQSVGSTTTGGGPWTSRILRAVMDSGFAAGMVPYHGALHPGAHEPLISPEDWTRYREGRDRRRRSGGRSERSAFLLSGLARCTLCGRTMVGESSPGRTAKYRCRGASELRLHPGGRVDARLVEAAVLEWLRPLAAGLVEQVAPAEPIGLPQLAARLEALDKRAVTIARRAVDGILPDDVYEALRDEVEDQRREVRASIAALQAAQVRAASDAPAAAADLLADWDLLPVANRREALKRLIASVEVTPGRPRARVRVVGLQDPSRT